MIFLNYLNLEVHFAFISLLLLLADFSFIPCLSVWISGLIQLTNRILFNCSWFFYFRFDWLMIGWWFSDAHGFLGSPMLMHYPWFMCCPWFSSLLILLWFSWFAHGFHGPPMTMVCSCFLNHTLLMLVMINGEGCFNPEFDSVGSGIDSGYSPFLSDMVAISALSAPSMNNK